MISWAGERFSCPFIFVIGCEGLIMKKLCERADQLSALLRSCLVAVLASEGLYLAMLTLFYGVLSSDVFMTRSGIITPLRDYMMLPWSGALLSLYLVREKKSSPDTWAMLLLVSWIAVPFIMRFGTEHFTVYAIYSYTLSFILFYCSVRQSDAKRRAHQLDVACMGFAVISIALGGALLYCAATGKTYCSYWDTMYFGVVKGQLQHGTHYNMTAMLAQLCALMCLTGLCRSRKKPYAIIYLLGLVIMTLVVVLTQSRTARYAMLAVFALGTWNGLAEYLPVRKALLRHAAALACAAVVLVGGYKLCGIITDAALAHYAGQTPQVLEAMLPSALAEDEAAEEAEKAPEATTKPRKARSQKVDSTFSDRTNIWKNIFKYWRGNPKYMLIGNGASRTQWLLHHGTIHENRGSIAMHNAYLHFAAEFGWIGFGILTVSMLLILPAVLRVFFARGERRMPGGVALCLLVLSILATGMMESTPLDVMTPMAMVLFFALGQLAGAGSDMKSK